MAAFILSKIKGATNRIVVSIKDKVPNSFAVRYWVRIGNINKGTKDFNALVPP